MTDPIDPVRLATIRNNYEYLRRAAERDPGRRLEADNADLGDLLTEVDRLQRELADRDRTCAQLTEARRLMRESDDFIAIITELVPQLKPGLPTTWRSLLTALDPDAALPDWLADTNEDLNQ